METGSKLTTNLRWLFILAGLGLILVCLIPGDLIIVYDAQSRMLHTQAWMHPFVWPLIGLGIVYIAVPFSERLRNRIIWITIGTGVLSIIILYGIEPFIWIKLLEFWLNTTISNPNALEVEISLLLIHWIIALFLIIGPTIYLLTKRMNKKWKFC